MPVDQFYRDFEAAFRGSRAEILQRLAVYRDFLSPLAEVSPSRKALDLGCGRGEWLELAGTIGFDAHGVDLDAGMLEDCFARGLSAEQGDAIAFLKAQPANSQAVISGFHIAEHLPFALLQDLIAEALRVLEPAGLLILETPNPENIRVGSMSFHMDPTHNKPLPPGLLSFLPRHHGFWRAEILRLQESAERRQAPTASLVDVFEGVSPDYAVVAQKAAEPEMLARFNAAFAKDRGLTLETLAERFEAGMTRQAEFEPVRSTVGQLEEQTRRLQETTRILQDSVAQLRADYEARLEAIQASTSWRVTEPLRYVGRIVHAARGGQLPARVVERVRPLGLSAVLAVQRQPRLRKAVIGTIRAVPGLEARLRGLLTLRQQPGTGWQKHTGPATLSPRGRTIYDKLTHLRDQ